MDNEIKIIAITKRFQKFDVNTRLVEVTYKNRYYIFELPRQLVEDKPAFRSYLERQVNFVP